MLWVFIEIASTPNTLLICFTDDSCIIKQALVLGSFAIKTDTNSVLATDANNDAIRVILSKKIGWPPIIYFLADVGSILTHATQII